MRQWQASPVSAAEPGLAMAGMIRALGRPDFPAAVLENVQASIPAASWSVYRTGRRSSPVMFLSAARGIPDRTRECWWAYLSGPYLHDRSFGAAMDSCMGLPHLCHVTVQEIPAEHRARVYEPHGMLERVSVVDQDRDGVFAVNFYRHAHQPPLRDTQIACFESIAFALLELSRKHIALAAPVGGRCLALEKVGQEATASLAKVASPGQLRERLVAIGPKLTAREVDICTGLLMGRTQEGIARDLGLSPATVKTYRNRAFERLGIHFRNELYARVLGLPGP